MWKALHPINYVPISAQLPIPWGGRAALPCNPPPVSGFNLCWLFLQERNGWDQFLQLQNPGCEISRCNMKQPENKWLKFEWSSNIHDWDVASRVPEGLGGEQWCSPGILCQENSGDSSSTEVELCDRLRLIFHHTKRFFQAGWGCGDTLVSEMLI